MKRFFNRGDQNANHYTALDIGTEYILSLIHI